MEESAPMTRLVLFDIDGTLILTGGAGVKAFAQTFAEEFGLPDATKSMQFAGRTDRALAFEIFRTNGIDPTEENFQRFCQAYTRRLANHLPADRTEPLPGVLEFLGTLETMPTPPVLGLLTGNLPEGARLKLSHYQLWHRFELGAFGDATVCRNEVAQTALEIARKKIPDLHPEEILVIGDTPADIHCAQAIGARVLAVATGQFTPAQLTEHEPTQVSENLAGIPPDFLNA